MYHRPATLQISAEQAAESASRLERSRTAQRASASRGRDIDPKRLLMTETQAAELLQVSPRTLQGWRLRGDGPKFVRIGRRVRYRLSDLDEFVEQAVRRSTSDPGPGSPKAR